MAALIDAIDVKRKTLFEFENTLSAGANVRPPTARGGQTLVRLKMLTFLRSRSLRSIQGKRQIQGPGLAGGAGFLFL